MFANISPLIVDFEETQSTLSFATRCRETSLQPPKSMIRKAKSKYVSITPAREKIVVEKTTSMVSPVKYGQIKKNRILDIDDKSPPKMALHRNTSRINTKSAQGSRSNTPTRNHLLLASGRATPKKSLSSNSKTSSLNSGSTLSMNKHNKSSSINSRKRVIKFK